MKKTQLLSLLRFLPLCLSRSHQAFSLGAFLFVRDCMCLIQFLKKMISKNRWLMQSDTESKWEKLNCIRWTRMTRLEFNQHLSLHKFNHKSKMPNTHYEFIALDGKCELSTFFFCRTGRSYLSHSCLTFKRASDFCAHCNILIFNIDKYVYIVLLACNVRIVAVIIFIEINFLWDFFIKIRTHANRRTIVFWVHVMMFIVDIHYIFSGSSTYTVVQKFGYNRKNYIFQ